MTDQGRDDTTPLTNAFCRRINRLVADDVQRRLAASRAHGHHAPVDDLTFARLYRLARAHGHHWADALVDREVYGGAAAALGAPVPLPPAGLAHWTPALVEALARAALPEPSLGGICTLPLDAHGHRTATGRLQWVAGGDRSLVLKVTRPDPTGVTLTDNAVLLAELDAADRVEIALPVGRADGHAGAASSHAPRGRHVRALVDALGYVGVAAPDVFAALDAAAARFADTPPGDHEHRGGDRVAYGEALRAAVAECREGVGSGHCEDGDVLLRDQLPQSVLNLRMTVDIPPDAQPALKLVRGLLPKRNPGDEPVYTVKGTIAAPVVR